MMKYLVVVLFSLAGDVQGQTTDSGAAVKPCMTTQAECSGGFSGISVINNHYYCCPAGHSMAMINMQCSCTRTSQVEPCGVGPVACRGGEAGGSLNSDGQGNTRCCRAGWSMQSMSGYVRGQFLDTCSCTRPLGGLHVIQGGDPTFNATAFEESMREWSQSFSQSLAASLQGVAGNVRGILSRFQF